MKNSYSEKTQKQLPQTNQNQDERQTEECE